MMSLNIEFFPTYSLTLKKIPYFPLKYQTLISRRDVLADEVMGTGDLAAHDLAVSPGLRSGQSLPFEAQLDSSAASQAQVSSASFYIKHKAQGGEGSLRWTQLSTCTPTRRQALCVCVCVCVRTRTCAQSCLSVTPWTVALQAPLSTGFSGREHCSGLPCPPPGHLLDSGIEPAVGCHALLQGISWTQGLNLHRL